MYLLLSLVALLGFRLAWYIHQHKKEAKPMVCPLQSDCEAVVHSDFSRFAGIPLELLGLAYYGLVTVIYLALWGSPELRTTPLVIFGSLTLTTLAFLFSMYLTFVQAFNLKQWCTWCLCSAGLCLLLFAGSMWVSPFPFIDLVTQYRFPIFMIHFLALTIGLGGTTVADLLFFKFLKDFRISLEEQAVLQTISQMIWASLAFIILTAGAIPLSWASTVLLVVILTNGAVLHLVVMPKLTMISFQSRDPAAPAVEALPESRLAFGLGAISTISWYALLLSELWPADWLFSLEKFFSFYAIVLFLGVVGSQLLERQFSRVRREATFLTP